MADEPGAAGATSRPTKPRPDGLDHPAVGKVLKRVAAAQVKVFRATGGRVGSRWRVGAGFRKPVPTLLLDHVGRRSGTRFTTPLLYLEHAGAWVVVASQGGMPTHPQWFHNLVAQPDTTIDLRGRAQVPVRARVAGPEERARLWPLLVDLYADFANYAVWAGEREIPVVVLEPR